MKLMVDVQKPMQAWALKSIVAGIIGTLDIIVFYVGISQGGLQNLVLTLVPIAIITFFGVMALSSLHSATTDKDSKGIMRKSLTSTLVLVFVAILAISYGGDLKVDPSAEKILTELNSSFTYVIITIIGFYFGTKSVREYLQIRYGKKEDEKKEDPTKKMQELDKKNLDRAKESGSLEVDDSKWTITKQKEKFKVGTEKEKDTNKPAQNWTSIAKEKEFDKEPTKEQKEELEKSLAKPKKPTTECSDGEWVEKESWKQWSEFKHKSETKWKVRAYSNIQWECKRKASKA